MPIRRYFALPSEAIYTGTLGGSIGGDGAGANGFKFAASLNGQTGVAVGSETVTYSVVGNVLTATVDSGVVGHAAVQGRDTT